MKILIFSWRDIKNPEAGGSELYFHELSKRWVKKGHEVTMICGGWKGCKKNENVEGIKIIRTGEKLSLYLSAPIAYLKLENKQDIIIDVENGIPFFAPLFSKTKKILHIHHVHKDVWSKEIKMPFAYAGWFIENKIMPLIYRNIDIITISNSSAKEIKKEFNGKVTGIVNPGIDFFSYKKFKKSKNPSLLFLNRIKKYKGVDVLLMAVKELKKEFSNCEVWIVGSGDFLDEMKECAKKEKLDNVIFFGRVSEEKKRELMQKAWIFVNPSFKEGWGIVNIEANYFGTPVIGSDVGGIRDSVINGKTGLLFEYGNCKELAKKIKLLLKNNKLRKKMEKESLRWASNFNWDLKAEEYLNILTKIFQS